MIILVLIDSITNPRWTDGIMRTSIIDKHYFLIDYIRRNRETSRNQITKFFNMNAATVGNIVDRLLNEEVIIEDGEIAGDEAAGAGRPPIALRLNPDASYFIGINFSGDSYCAVMTDFTGNAVMTIADHFPLPVKKDRVLGSLISAVNCLIADSGIPRDKLSGIGVGAPGVVNMKTNCVLRYPRIKGFENVNIADVMGPIFSLPVFVDHNSNCFAAGEVNLGSAGGFLNTVNIIIRTGIAMGIIRNREIFSMSEISAGELGHITINPKGGKCWCGNKGCLETLISGWALEKTLKKALRLGDIEKMYSPEEFARLAVDGNPFAVAVLNEMFDYLGIAISDVIRLLRPQAVVINGCFNAAGELMSGRINQVIQDRAGINDTEIIISEHDDRIGACGAALMAISRLHNPFYQINNAVQNAVNL